MLHNLLKYQKYYLESAKIIFEKEQHNFRYWESIIIDITDKKDINNMNDIPPSLILFYFLLNTILQRENSSFADLDQFIIIQHWESIMQSIIEREKADSNYTLSYEELSSLFNSMDPESDLPYSSVENMSNVVYQYSEYIHKYVSPFVVKELKQTEGYYHNARGNKEIIKRILDEQVVETGTSIFYHKLRETISKNEFFPDNTFIPSTAIKENRFVTVAQLLPSTGHNKLLMTDNQIKTWKKLMTESIYFMDDLTADIFDILSILWLYHSRLDKRRQMVKLHTDDILELRKIKSKTNGRKQVNGFRPKERLKITERIAALASILVIKKERESFNREEFNHKIFDMSPLFIFDNVKISDPTNKEPNGVLTCEFRPGDLLLDTLRGEKKQTGAFPIGILHFNPHKHKYHKRLARYLIWQWRIRRRRGDYDRPYKIGGNTGLINVMGMKINRRFPSKTRDLFEDILDALQINNIVANWHYVDIDENLIGQGNKGWLENYWLNLKVVIKPPNV